jgi:hypothetical protein
MLMFSGFLNAAGKIRANTINKSESDRKSMNDNVSVFSSVQGRLRYDSPIPLV